LLRGFPDEIRAPSSQPRTIVAVQAARRIPGACPRG
jgi:hypothetical protein